MANHGKSSSFDPLKSIEGLLIRRLHLRHLLSGTVELGPDVALAEQAIQQAESNGVLDVHPGKWFITLIPSPFLTNQTWHLTAPALNGNLDGNIN